MNYFGDVTLKDKKQSEKLLASWIKLSGMVKNSRITKGLMYNEAVVMHFLYERYKTDSKGIVSIKEIVERTKMLKSLINRTINSLEEKGLLLRCEDQGDRRISFVRCVPEKLDTFFEVHKESLKVAESIIEIIGEKDAEAFIRIVSKLESADYCIN